MELTIDKFGRVVLPKKLREHLGVGASLKVEVTEMTDGVLLRPVRSKSGLTIKNGLLVHGDSSARDESIDWNNLVADEREERIHTLIGR